MAKKVNYTPEMVMDMTATYEAAETDAERKSAVEVLAKRLGRSVPSVRTKLSQLKVYIKPNADNATNKPVTVKKAELIANIESALGLEIGEGNSLKTVTNAVLTAIMEALAANSPEQVSAEGDSADAAQESTES